MVYKARLKLTGKKPLGLFFWECLKNKTPVPIDNVPQIQNCLRCEEANRQNNNEGHTAALSTCPCSLPVAAGAVWASENRVSAITGIL